MTISVIIPALNEERTVGGAIHSARGSGEVIVVDGGSGDGTREVAEKHGARVVRGGRGRGLQIDEGAKAATGDILLFLHADTRLPAGWPAVVTRAMAPPGVAGGAFRLKIDSPRTIFRLIEGAANMRARCLGLIFGDQAIFTEKETFFALPSLRGLPLMEDVECVKRLRRRGKVVVVSVSVATSPRRWGKGRALSTTLKNLSLLIRYLLGASPEKLYLTYYRNR